MDGKKVHGVHRDPRKVERKGKIEDLDWEDSSSESKDATADDHSKTPESTEAQANPVPARRSSFHDPSSRAAEIEAVAVPQKPPATERKERSLENVVEAPREPKRSEEKQAADASKKPERHHHGGTGAVAGERRATEEPRMRATSKERREKKERKTSMRQSRSQDDFKEFSTLQPLSRRTVARAALGTAPPAMASPPRTTSDGQRGGGGLDWAEALSATANMESSSPRDAPAIQVHSASSSPRPVPQSPAPERNKIRALFSSMVIGFKGSDSTASASAAAPASRALALFGVSLDELASRNRTDVPPAISALLSALHEHVHTEGIFRVSAAVSDVAELRATLEKGELDALASASAHTLSGLFTAFLMDLPEPLIPFALYDDALAAAALPDGSPRASALNALVARLPRPSASLLRQLTQLLQATERQSASNKMAATSIGVVFGPLVLRPRKETLDMRKILLQNSFVEAIIRSPLDDIPSSSAFPSSFTISSSLSAPASPAPHSSTPLSAASMLSRGSSGSGVAASRPLQPPPSDWDAVLGPRDWLLLESSAAMVVRLRRSDIWPRSSLPPRSVWRLRSGRVHASGLLGGQSEELNAPAELAHEQLFDSSISLPSLRCVSDEAELVILDAKSLARLLDADSALGARFARYFALKGARQLAQLMNVDAKLGSVTSPLAVAPAADSSRDADSKLRDEFNLKCPLLAEYAVDKRRQRGFLYITPTHWCFYNPTRSGVRHSHALKDVAQLERNAVDFTLQIDDRSRGKRYIFGFVSSNALSEAATQLATLSGLHCRPELTGERRFFQLFCSDSETTHAMSPADWSNFYSACSSFRASRGDVLLHSGKQSGRAIFVLASGSASVTSEWRSSRLPAIEPGERFGQVEWLLDCAGLCTITADEGCEIKASSTAALFDLFARFPMLIARLHLQLSEDVLTSAVRLQALRKGEWM